MKKRGLLVLSISAFVIAIGIGIITPILPIYTKQLGASGFFVGLVFSSLFASMAICNPLVGILSDRYGKRAMIVSGFGIGTLIAYSYTLADGPYFLILVRLIHGVIAAMVAPTIMAYLGEISPQGEEGLYMGVYNGMLLLGGSAGPILGGRISDLWGMNHSFYFFAVSMGACFFLTFLFLPDQRPGKSTLSKTPVKQMLQSSTLKGLFVLGFTLAIANSGLMVFMPLLASDLLLTNTEIGILASSFVLTAGIFQVPFGWVANQISRKNLIMTGTLLIALGLALMPLTKTFIFLLSIGVAMGVASAMANPAANAMCMEHGREIGVGLVAGTMNSFNNLGMIIGPISAGIIMDQINLASAFYTYAVIFLVGAGLFYYFTRGSSGLVKTAEE